MSKENVKAFWNRNKGKIVFAAGFSVAAALACIGIRRKYSKFRTYDCGVELYEPIPLKDVVAPFTLDKIDLEFLSKHNITGDTLIVDVAFKIKDSVN